MYYCHISTMQKWLIILLSHLIFVNPTVKGTDLLSVTKQTYGSDLWYSLWKYSIVDERIQSLSSYNSLMYILSGEIKCFWKTYKFDMTKVKFPAQCCHYRPNGDLEKGHYFMSQNNLTPGLLASYSHIHIKIILTIINLFWP